MARTMPAMDAARAAAELDRSIDHFHPLEIFPFFRRWPHGPFRDLLYTFIWNCSIGVFFWTSSSVASHSSMSSLTFR